MDLIGNHEHPMLFADVEHAADLVFLPDASDRIMRRAEDERLDVFTNYSFLEAVVVHFIAAVRMQKWAVHQSSAVVFDCPHERIINRLHDCDSLPLTGQDLYQPVECRHNARSDSHPFALHFIAVVSAFPFDECIVVAVRRIVVTECAKFYIIRESPANAFRHLKIHVCDPHRQQVAPAERFLEAIPFEAVCISSVYVSEHTHHLSSFISFL